MKNLFVLLTALSTIFFISCDNDETTDSVNILSDTEKAVVTNDAAVDNLAEAADYEVDYFTGSNTAISGIGGSKALLPPRNRYLDGIGPTVTVQPEGDVYPKTITIDYGQGVELVNGRILTGQIIIVVSAPPLTNGATREITYQEFYVDSTNVAGGGVCTFTGTDSTQRVFATNSDITLTFNDESVLYRHGEHNRILAEGFETVYDHSDDLILISGFVNYITEEELTFSKTIIEPLTKTGDCRYIVEGVVEFTLDEEVFATLDYGDGTCDDIATITKDGETIQITINRRRGFPRNR